MTTETKKPRAKRAPKAPDRDELARLVEIGAEYAPTQRLSLLHRLQTEENAKVTDKGGATHFTLARLSAQSTAGATDALNNWLNKARRIVRGVA